MVKYGYYFDLYSSGGAGLCAPLHMKHLFNLLLATTALLGLLPHATASDRWETLQAINWVENPTNHHHSGSKGELGPYQFRRDTWRMHTSVPFSQAVNRGPADVVAVKHYEYIKRGLQEAGIAASPFNIALAWNCGLGAVVGGRVPSVTYRYAEQVNNLVETLKQRPQLAGGEIPHPTEGNIGVMTALAPHFAIGDGSPRFFITGDAPRFVLAE